MTNWIPQGKAITLIKENNQHKTQQSIAKKAYTYIFSNFEIMLSKKFTLNVLDNLRFAKKLYLFIIDKIYLIEEWGKSFWPVYSKIEQLQKKYPIKYFY